MKKTKKMRRVVWLERAVEHLPDRVDEGKIDDATDYIIKRFEARDPDETDVQLMLAKRDSGSFTTSSIETVALTVMQQGLQYGKEQGKKRLQEVKKQGARRRKREDKQRNFIGALDSELVSNRYQNDPEVFWQNMIDSSAIRAKPFRKQGRLWMPGCPCVPHDECYLYWGNKEKPNEDLDRSIGYKRFKQLVQERRSALGLTQIY
jgi:hypothetical protein